MKQKIHRVLSLLLCCVMLVGLLPTTAFADYETGMECPDCGHYHWDTYMCFCGYCSEECTNATCWAENHCVRCGTCHEVTAYCADCGWCQECMEEEGHCLDCYKCVENDDDLCQTCGKCEDCVGWLCMDCGQCDECTDDGEFHCEECGGCYETNGHNHGTHCADCCEICEQCGECIILNETEFCFECGLCEACCEDNRHDSDCSCGEYCVESVEFEEHFCEFCGNCFDDVDQCDLCYLCADCCADNSDCSDGMCVENDEYEDHFCEDCGSCFHDADQCETCANEAGELRCVFCCESLASSYGCGCGDVCVNDPDFEKHLDTVHSEDGEIGEHAARPQNVWSMDGTDHWHGCRLCNEDAHITDKANHTYDKYGVCTVCGFKQGAAVFITHQPKDTYAKVTDINADESDPLHGQNNKVSFKVSAYGEGLRYQWYRVAGTGAPVALTTSDPRVPSYGEGATTDKVTVSVPGDACTTVYTYYCVVTDKDGHTAESIHARIKAGHVYSRCQNVATGSKKTIYIQSGETYVTKKYQDSEGHFWSCCGEEDFGDGETNFGNTRTKAPVNHSYGNQELIKATIYSDYAQAGKFSTYYRYTCSDCGHQIYVEKHTHNFVVPISDTEYLEANCTALTHPLVCTVGGCTETRTEQHRWQWDIVKYPKGSEAGGMKRECLDCGYWENTGWTDKNSNPVQWTTANMLVTAVHGTVNRSMAAPGDKLTLTPEQIDGQMCTGWTADYTDYSGETRVTKTVSVTVTQNSDGTWSCTVPAFADMGVNGGGQLGFEAQFAACSHTGGTKTEGAREPVCTRNGNTGDTVCVDCGQILTGGDSIAAPGYHTGTLTLVPGTEVEADCTHRGYTGDFKCSACGGIVAGERTGYDHSTEGLVGYVAPTCTTEGYSGDEVCSNCRKVVSHGKKLPAAHGSTTRLNPKEATCTEAGRDGNVICQICHEIVEYGSIRYPLGHDWNDGEKIKDATETERGEILYTCERDDCGATKIEYIPRLVPGATDITAANVTVTAPTKGGTPVGAATTDTQYTVANTVWEPADNPFAPNTVYSVLVTLEAKEGYQFTASTVFKINDSTATVVTQSAEEAKISFTFPATEAETSLKWIPVPAAKTGLTYTGSELTGVKAGTGYTLTGNTATDAGSYTAVATLSSGYMWSDGTSEDKSIPWSIAKAMQAAPTGLTGIAPTEGNSDGKITGVTEQMEYRAEDASVYTLCFGTEITGLAAGNYFVRYKEDANHFASADTLVSVGSTATADVFTITFDANGGEGSMSAESVPAGTNYVLPACGFTAPDGKEFDKWQIGETDYAVGATYTVNDNTTIKAVWKNKTAPTTTYTVSFAAGDGTGSMSAQTVNAGTEYELPACGFTAPANKEFRAWSIGGTERAPGDKFTVNADTTVTAVWKDKPVEITSFEITFNANGGSVTTTSATTGADGKLATLPTPTRSGYRFNGWYTAASGGTKVTTSYQFTADTTVYAHWTKKTPSGPSGSGSNSGTTIIQSAKTADIGVMIYGMTALLSLTGGAWVVNKKRKGK